MEKSSTQSFGASPSWNERASARQGRVGINLYTRLTLCCFAVGAATASATFILQYRSMAGVSVATKRTTEFARSLAAAVGKSAQLDLRSADRTALQDRAAESIRLDVVGVASFFDSQGNLLATAGSQEKIVGPTMTVRVPVTDEGISFRGKGEPNSTIGSVELVVTSPPQIAQARPIGQELSYVLAGTFALASLFAMLFIRNAFQPLRRMIGAMKKIGDGELDCMVPASKVPLFQQIANGINALAELIRKDRIQYVVSERKHQSVIVELEKKLEARTVQLEAANGRLSGEIAEKEDFLRAVSHDLNAPLRNIGGMVSMLLTKNKADLSEDVQGRLERIKKNVDVETDLINELLELSRIKSHERHLTLVDTEAMLWELRGMFENDLKSRNIELVIETSLPPLYAERSRVRQVFQNLIDNAIKYMGDRPTRQIRVGCKVNIAEAEFYVSDTGMGIHEDDLPKMFYVFRRGRGEFTHKIPGKGVGLASVKAIIETYAGRIWAESKIGVGTTLRFIINGKFVPSVSGQVPSELEGDSIPKPALAAHAA